MDATGTKSHRSHPSLRLPSVIQGLTVFLISAVVDAVWAKYIAAASAHKALAAAAWSAGIIFCGSFVTVEYVTNHWLALPAALGAFVGTYLTIWWGKRGGRP